MAEVDDILEEVERLLATVRPREAEQRMTSLISTMGEAELRAWEVDLRRTISDFLPKRRAAVTAALNHALGAISAPKAGDTLAPAGVDIDPTEVAASFEIALGALIQHHIFQWSTFYRDCLSEFFDLFLDAARRSSDSTLLAKSIGQPLSAHSADLFAHGYEYVTRESRDTTDHAISKSLNGLQRFLDLPIEFYATKIPLAIDIVDARALRTVCSAMLAAILRGYARVVFDWRHGGQVLADNPQAWLHAVAFLTGHDLAELLAYLDPGPLRDGLSRSVTPMLGALDGLGASANTYVPLPALAQFLSHEARLDVSLHPPPLAGGPHLIELQCFLTSDHLRRESLDEAANRGVAAVIAPSRADLAPYVARNDRLRSMFVSVDPEVSATSSSAALQRIQTVLEYAIYTRRSARASSEPLRYNFAREFPLNNPFLTRYFHVYRSSVRDLLRTFERRNGVRLWCSVRRSGKTTACLDLSSTTGQSTVVSQTCDSTGQLPGGSLFYDAVLDALGSGRQLDRSFFESVVRRSAESRSVGDERVVFVLDEYETLFGSLSGALSRDSTLRYTVVQPLLNQMVAFTRDNLLVFLGQQPNAYFILMDQNQLSAYVEQDAFPLFRHNPNTLNGEFVELLRKVLTERVAFDTAFADAMFAETAGHPFLTVNLLTEVVDWLIASRRAVSTLVLTGEDFHQLSRERLAPARVSLSPEYRFFREGAVSQALGASGRRDTPWLFGVYKCLRGLALSSPESLEMSRQDFESMVSRSGLDELGLTSNLLLSSGTQANFLDYDEAGVRPRIPLLARIAAVAQPAIGP